MTNAKQEFLAATKDVVVICASVRLDRSYTWWNENDEELDDILTFLPMEYTEEEYQKFLSELDFEYDSGYGTQLLFGTIWCNNGIWFDRGEYDGSEWWRLNAYPEIPEHLKSKI